MFDRGISNSVPKFKFLDLMVYTEYHEIVFSMRSKRKTSKDLIRSGVVKLIVSKSDP